VGQEEEEGNQCSGYTFKLGIIVQPLFMVYILAGRGSRQTGGEVATTRLRGRRKTENTWKAKATVGVAGLKHLLKAGTRRRGDTTSVRWKNNGSETVSMT